LIFPGATETELFEVIENPKNRKIQSYGPLQSASQVAGAVIQAIRKPAVEIITQRHGRLQNILHASSPALADWLVRKTVKRNVDI